MELGLNSKAEWISLLLVLKTVSKNNLHDQNEAHDTVENLINYL